MFVLLLALIPYVCQPVIYLHTEPKKASPPCSQAVYGTRLEVKEEVDDFAFVQTEDLESGWIQSSDYVWIEEEHRNVMARVDSLKAHVYAINNLTLQIPILSLPYGSLVEWVQETDSRWVQVRLLDKAVYWMQRNDLKRELKRKDVEEMILFACRFLERPYTWGGYSSEGLDCSGFTKLCFKEQGIFLPHSSRKQSEMGEIVLLENIQRGDLLFFGEDKVSHVAIYLGDNKLIHACPREPFRPAVRIEDFTDSWKNRFILARRISS